MTALKAHEVGRFLKRPDLDEGIFLAYGPDAGLVRETAQVLARFLAGPDPSPMSFVTLEAGDLDADPGRLAVEARTVSLFGEKRVIRVRGAGKGVVPTLAALQDDLSGIAIVLEAGNLTPKDPLRALVETLRQGRALPCYPDTEETLSALIRETFAAAGIAVDADVVPNLRALLGNDREVTRRELDKLVLYAQDTRSLSLEDVLVLCADNAALVTDAIADAVGTGHAARLQDALERALAAAVDPQRVLAAVSGHFAQLRRWRAEVDSGRRIAEVIENARPKPHFSRRASLEQQLRLWNEESLAQANRRLYEATADTRKRYALAETVLRRALLGLCLMAAER